MADRHRLLRALCPALLAGLILFGVRDLPGQSSPTPDPRIAEIEKQLDELTRLVETLRLNGAQGAGNFKIPATLIPPPGFHTVVDAIQAELKSIAQQSTSQPAYFGVQLAADTPGKLVVRDVEPDSPAAKAGLQPEDVLLEVDGQKASDAERVKDLLQSKSPGETVSVKLLRQQDTIDLAVSLVATSRPLTVSGQRVVLGVRTTEQDDGVRIDRVTDNSPAAQAGLKSGDIITKIDEAVVGAVAKFSDILAEKKAGETITLALQRDGAEQRVEITLPPAEEAPSPFFWDNRALSRWKKDAYRLAVVLIDYPDAEHNAKVTPADWDRALFSRDVYKDKSATGQKVFGSLNDYYVEQSCGAFHVEGKCFEAVKLERKRADYINDRVRTTLLTETLDKLFERDGGESLKDFDGVLFVYSGGRVQTNRGGIYWPHRSSVTHKGRRIPYVVISDGGREMSSISVICHEFGHLLGLPDLYARPENPGSEGLGGWCVMSNQNGNGRPQHFSAWCKEQLGWLKPAVIDPTVKQKLVLAPIECSPQECFKVLVRPDGSEYLLLENRAKTGFDTDLPGEGLLIWRVVDGRPQLEESHGIAGPAGPGSFRGVVPFPSRANNSFTPYTLPSSRSQKGGGLPVHITNIQRLPDGRLTFLVGFEFL